MRFHKCAFSSALVGTRNISRLSDCKAEALFCLEGKDAEKLSLCGASLHVINEFLDFFFFLHTQPSQMRTFCSLGSEMRLLMN